MMGVLSRTVQITMRDPHPPPSAVRGAAPSSGGRDAFSASRSEGPDWPAERATRRKGDPSEGRPISEGQPSEGDPSEEIFRREG